MDESSNEGKMDSPLFADQGWTFLKNITTRRRVMDGSFLRLTGYFLMAEAVYVFLNHCPRYLSSQLRSYLNRSLFFFSFTPVFSFRPKLLHPGFPPSRAFWGFLSVLFFPQEEACRSTKLFNNYSIKSVSYFNLPGCLIFFKISVESHPRG